MVPGTVNGFLVWYRVLLAFSVMVPGTFIGVNHCTAKSVSTLIKDTNAGTISLTNVIQKLDKE